MNTVRAALTTAGALAAMAAGAATASWGLTPLAGSMNAPAPQIVASDVSQPGATTTIGGVEDGPQTGEGAATLDTTPAAYTVPQAPPADADPDGPRPESEPATETSAPMDPASGVNPRLGDEDREATPDTSNQAGDSLPHSASPGDASANSGGAGVGVGPD